MRLSKLSRMIVFTLLVMFNLTGALFADNNYNENYNETYNERSNRLENRDTNRNLIIDNQPIFPDRAAVYYDIAVRLDGYVNSVFDKATPPPTSNRVFVEGDVSFVFNSGNFGAFGITTTQLVEGRMDCGNQSAQLGCSRVNNLDHLIVYAHLESYLSCRFDGTDIAVIVNLIYKRLPNGNWILLTQ